MPKGEIPDCEANFMSIVPCRLTKYPDEMKALDDFYNGSSALTFAVISC